MTATVTICPDDDFAATVACPPVEIVAVNQVIRAAVPFGTWLYNPVSHTWRVFGDHYLTAQCR